MSRYSKLLTKIIAESGYTAKQIVDKCNEIGNGIDTTRLSKLQSGKLPAPSEKVSRDISRICKVDERKLVIEGYLEKAPKEIIEAFSNIKTNAVTASLKIFENHINKEQLEFIKKEMEKQPLFDVVIELIDNKNQEIEMSCDGFNIKDRECNISLQEPIAIPVSDNAMFPIIPKGSKISLSIQEKYENGDTLAIKIKNNENIIVRNVFFLGQDVVLMGINKKYENETYNNKEIKILGKVTKVITEL